MALPESPWPSMITDHAAIATHMNKPLSWVDSMLVDRRGTSADSVMAAIGLRVSVSRGQPFVVSSREGLARAESSSPAIDLERAAHERHDPPPPHAVVTAKWDTEVTVGHGNENILGDNVVFTVEGSATAVKIPVVEATKAATSYYAATVVHDGDTVVFPVDNYPIWGMRLGKEYVRNYLMTERGHGFYLEYHNDAPHWHQPLSRDSGGFYILGRMVSSGPSNVNVYHITGFSIAKGTAVYSSLGAIHCDAALTGERWLVGYTDAADFSTALVRNSRGAWVEFVGDRTDQLQ